MRFLPGLSKVFARYGVLLILLALTAAARCWNHADIWVAGKTFYVDGDCYSRMTRVKEVFEHPGTVVHEHRFENWPQGTRPHTTAPFDYAVAGLAWALRGLIASPLDLAGALISPLLGVLTAGFLWFWAGRLGLPYRIPMIILFATSPILVHGTVLGRPDHQSLLILCVAVALGAEAVLLNEESRGWAIAGGLAWGLALWTSLYEPSILLVIVLGLRLCLAHSAFRWKGTRLGNAGSGSLADWAWRCGSCVFVLAWATFLDGWHSPVPEPEVVRYFPNWSLSIGELGHATLPLLLRWSCALLTVTLPLLGAGLLGRESRLTSFLWLGLVASTGALSVWQLRWGYFFALVFAMSLPWQLGVLERLIVRRIAAVVTRRAVVQGAVLGVFAVSLWPVFLEWSERLFPSGSEVARRTEERSDSLELWGVAQQLRGSHRLPILAPWWMSPALAYWSGQPCVAGSSHESLPGTVDTARFFLSEDPEAAEAILEKRKVACIVAYEPERVMQTSRMILNGLATTPSLAASEVDLGDAAERAMGVVLYRRPHRSPSFLQLVYTNAAFRVFLRPKGVTAEP